ncbi:tripeptidyl peptidase A [Sanghuangporus baumii]|uniref:tripeptidyl-peptidase II n=1 Tax=Sanghuangporus baumii TaxID=108892 RepID=A0A9Q5HSV9_SANBA|nr:tripeptidyl peptidase A [Sanghuangporus baumii]
MDLLLSLLVWSLFSVHCCLSSPSSPLVNGVGRLKERVSHPRGWAKGIRAPPNQILELKIALPQPSFHVLEQHLYEVSDPEHARYGQHLSKAEVEALVAPHPESVTSVDSWLQSHGIEVDDLVRSPAKDWVTVRIPVSQAEMILSTEYHIWTHEESGDTVVRTLQYSVPEQVYDHVELIQPTTMFARIKKQRTTFRWSSHQDIPPFNHTKITLPNGISVDASCNTTVTIDCLLELYNAVGFNASGTIGNQIGITGYLEQFANIADLQLFYADQRPEALNSSFKFISVAGGQNSQNVSEAGVEANLDTQFAFGLTFPTPSTFFSTAGRPPFIPDIGTPTNTNEPYLTWLDFVLALDNPPQAISTSYGDDEQTVPRSFAQRVCNSFAQLGARGVTLTFSSGDGGVGDGDPDPATQECITNDGRNATEFIPGFPASCPFVTAVGGTIFIPEVIQAIHIEAFSLPYKFSNRLQSTSPEEDLAISLLVLHIKTQWFKPTWTRFRKERMQDSSTPKEEQAIPDVSALADNFKIFFQGRAGLIGGTSASSPTFAGFVALLNDVRLANGKPPLGFLNPFLYSLGKFGFSDITVGNNPGCGTPGFNATVGWDPVTGFGTPDFGKLKELVLL